MWLMGFWKKASHCYNVRSGILLPCVEDVWNGTFQDFLMLGLLLVFQFAMHFCVANVLSQV